MVPCQSKSIVCTFHVFLLCPCLVVREDGSLRPLEVGPDLSEVVPVFLTKARLDKQRNVAGRKSNGLGEPTK